MKTGFSFPPMKPQEIAEGLNTYGYAPAGNLRPEDIANPQPDLLPGVLSRFLDSVADPSGDLDGDDSQLGFHALEALDNPEHHAEGIRVLRLYNRARAFLESIQFHGFTMTDLLNPHPVRVAEVLSALLNFVYYREDKLSNVLQPIFTEFPDFDERRTELKARIAEHQKAIADAELAAQVDEPVVQELEAEVNGLKQKVQVYNKQQNALRGKAKAINDKKEEMMSKIKQADFELMKHAQENAKLSSKLVQSPEKLKRTLEEKRSARAELKNSEKMAMQNVQEKSATLERYSKAYEKLEKQFSKIQDLHEQLAAAKTVEKEVKACKSKLSDERVSIRALDAKILEAQGKVHETKERLEAKVKERDRRIADENQKLSALRSETEWKLKGLEPREREVEAMVTKASNISSEADSARTAATAVQQKIKATIEEVRQEFNSYVNTINPVLERGEEMLAGDNNTQLGSHPGPTQALSSK